MPETPPSKSLNILFLDVKGWSALEPDECRSYYEIALKTINDYLAAAQHRNTWGDAIVATFVSAAEAAEAALKIRDFFVSATRRDGMPSAAGCRIALHNDEVLVLQNPVTGREDIVGQGVNLAARLEPVTPVGWVLASEVFAGRLRRAGGTGCRAESLGPVPLPKDAGVPNVACILRLKEPAPSKEAWLKHVETLAGSAGASRGRRSKRRAIDGPRGGQRNQQVEPHFCFHDGEACYDPAQGCLRFSFNIRVVNAGRRPVVLHRAAGIVEIALIAREMCSVSLADTSVDSVGGFNDRVPSVEVAEGVRSWLRVRGVWPLGRRKDVEKVIGAPQPDHFKVRLRLRVPVDAAGQVHVEPDLLDGILPIDVNVVEHCKSFAAAA